MTFLYHIPRAFIRRVSTCYFEMRKYGTLSVGFWIDSGMCITFRNRMNLTINDAGCPVFGYPLFISLSMQMWLRIKTDYVLETTTGIRFSKLNFRNCTPLFLTQDLPAYDRHTSYIYRFQNVFLRCPTPRLHCFLSSHWPSFRFL
jgi:hypothetical protein